MNPLIHSKKTTILPLLIPLALAWFVLSPTARAVSPPPDGGYPGGNTAEGANALFSLTTGINNTANGFRALGSNTIANRNTGVGYKALSINNTNDNTAVGWSALAASTGTNSGGEGGNTAVGSTALANNTAGVGNTGIGWNALVGQADADNNTAVGAAALAQNTGGGNTALGTNAGVNLTTGFNNIDIGDGVTGFAEEHDTIRIGASQATTYIAGIYGQVVAPATGTPVLIDGSGRLGTILGPISSARRFKHDIKAMDKASESILALKPVTFRYKKELDPEGIPQFGLVAEEVEKVNPDLVARDEEGKPYSVRYEAVNAMLLNEFLKARRQIDAQQKQIEALTAGLQKVSAQLELSKSARQTVSNNQ